MYFICSLVTCSVSHVHLQVEDVRAFYGWHVAPTMVRPLQRPPPLVTAQPADAPNTTSSRSIAGTHPGIIAKKPRQSLDVGAPSASACAAPRGRSMPCSRSAADMASLQAAGAELPPLHTLQGHAPLQGWRSSLGTGASKHTQSSLQQQQLKAHRLSLRKWQLQAPTMPSNQSSSKVAPPIDRQQATAAAAEAPAVHCAPAIGPGPGAAATNGSTAPNGTVRQGMSLTRIGAYTLMTGLQGRVQRYVGKSCHLPAS